MRPRPPQQPNATPGSRPPLVARCVLGRASAVLSSPEPAVSHLQDQGLDCGSNGQGSTLETLPWGAGVSAGAWGQRRMLGQYLGSHCDWGRVW